MLVGFGLRQGLYMLPLYVHYLKPSKTGLKCISIQAALVASSLREMRLLVTKIIRYALFAASESFRHLIYPPTPQQFSKSTLDPSFLPHLQCIIAKPSHTSPSLWAHTGFTSTHTHTGTPQQNTSMKPIKKSTLDSQA